MESKKELSFAKRECFAKKECFALPLELIHYILLQDASNADHPLMLLHMLKFLNKLCYEFISINLIRYRNYYIERHQCKLDTTTTYCCNYNFRTYPIINSGTNSLALISNGELFKISDRCHLYRYRNYNLPYSLDLTTRYYNEKLDDIYCKNNTFYLNERIKPFKITLRWEKYLLTNNLLSKQGFNIVYLSQEKDTSKFLIDYICIDYTISVYFSYDEDDGIKLFIIDNHRFTFKKLEQFKQFGYVTKINRSGKEFISSRETRILKINYQFMPLIFRLYNKYKNMYDIINFKRITIEN